MTVIGQHRALLHDQLLQRVNLPPERVHAYPAAPPTPPCLWIDAAALRYRRLVTGTLAGSFTVVGWSVWIVVDGAVRAQVEQLDDLVAQVWDAAWHTEQLSPVAAEPTYLRPEQLAGASGDRWRAVVVNAESDALAHTLDPDPILTVESVAQTNGG